MKPDSELENLVAEWNVHKLAEARAQVMKMEENDNRPIEDIRQSVYEDQLFWEHEWEIFRLRVSELIREVGKRYKYGVYHVRGSQIGWRNHSGARLFDLSDDPASIVEKVTPTGGDVTIEVVRKRDGYTPALHFTVYHHDSPTGESYTVTPVYADIARRFLHDGEQAAMGMLA